MQREISIFRHSTAESERILLGRNLSVSLPGPAAVNVRTIASNRDHVHSTKEREVLTELFELLEEYGPAWYTEEHHNRIIAALKNQ